MRSRTLVAAGAITLAIAACGALPPQAPFRQAQKLDSATSGIARACGESYQVSAFPGHHAHELASLDSSATTSAHKLAGVLHRNPAWIYQGQTISEIAADGTSMLRACDLHHAADVLARATRSR
jgi:hypothetical protein